MKMFYRKVIYATVIVLFVSVFFIIKTKFYLLQVPEYLRKEIAITINMIQNVSEDNSIVIPIYSDIHTINKNEQKFESLNKSIRYIANAVNCDFCVSLGDELNVDYGRKQHILNDNITQLLIDMHKSMNNISIPFFPINGNHDGIGTDFFNKELWIKTLPTELGEPLSSYVHRPKDEAYYYLDYSYDKIRFIFLSIPYTSDLVSNPEHPTPIWSFGIKQLKWLANVALNTEDDYTIFVFSHVPTCYLSGLHEDNYNYSTWNGKMQTFSNYYDLCGWVEDQKTIEGIFTAYHKHSFYQDININCDYSRYKNTKVGMEICGHAHCDFIIGPGEIGTNGVINGMPCTVVGIGSAGGYESEMPGWEDSSYNFERELGTESEILFDVMVINTNKLKVDFIRAGAGKNRRVTY